MTRLRTAAATALALALMTGAGATAFGQSEGQQRPQQMQQGMPMQPGMMGQTPGMMGQMPSMMGQMPGMTGQGPMGRMGPHMMSPDEMHAMMEHMAGMMSYGMPMMSHGMGHGPMAEGMGPRTGGWSGLEGQRVVPMVQLSTDDVRGFLGRHLAALGNERLKVGKVEATDEDRITAEIVTVDDSLVERFEIDRHTGLISAAG